MTVSKRAVSALSALIVAAMLGGILTAYATGTGTVDPPPRTAFIARADNPADALAAGPIAGRLGAPLFTTPSHVLDAHARDGLIDHDPELVILAGGQAALSADVENAVRTALPGATIRRVFGAGRTETARRLAETIAEYDPAFLPVDATALRAVEAQTAQTAQTALTADDADLLDGMDSTAFASRDLGLRHATLDGAVLLDATSAAPLDVLTIDASFAQLCGDEDTYHQVLLTANATASLHSPGQTLAAIRASVGDEPVNPLTFAGASAEGVSTATLAFEGSGVAALSPLSSQRYIGDLAPGDVTFKLRAALSSDIGTQRIQGARLTVLPLGHTCGAPADVSAAASAAAQGGTNG